MKTRSSEAPCRKNIPKKHLAYSNSENCINVLSRKHVIHVGKCDSNANILSFIFDFSVSTIGQTCDLL